jgi:hypothetical protein
VAAVLLAVVAGVLLGIPLQEMPEMVDQAAAAQLIQGRVQQGLDFIPDRLLFLVQGKVTMVVAAARLMLLAVVEAVVEVLVLLLVLRVAMVVLGS